MNANVSLEKTFLDPGVRLRPLHMSDAEAVAQLIYDACVAEGDAALSMSAEELRHEWQDPDFKPETDGFVVETTEGRLVGYDEVMNSYRHATFEMNGNAHPNFKGRGIGTTLLRAVEKRARELMSLAEPDVRVSIRTTITKQDLDSVTLHQNEGYDPIRYHWRMEIALDGPPPEAKFPAGIELRPFIKGEHDAAVCQSQNEAFREHPGSQDWTLEEWRRARLDDPEFDASLWAVAWDTASNEVAGHSINRYRSGIGWIRNLGVRPSWRKRGLGQALLNYSFGEYYRRGTKTIGLGVNAHNPTGATRLYQKVGMYPASEHVTYEKELRSGREPA